LKVLHLLNSAAGGAAVSTALLMDGLRSRGIASCAVCHPSGTAEERRRVAEAARGEVLFAPLYWWNRKTRAALWKRPLLQLRQFPSTGWGIFSARRVLAFALQRQATLLHTNTILNPEGGTVARTLGLPHVWHIRERLGPGQPFRLPVEGPAFGRYMARNASRLVANSATTADLVRGWLAPEQLAVVPNGVDLRRFRPRRPSSSPSSPVVVAMVANLTSRWKKHHLFLEAAHRVLRDGSPPVQFRLYGHDPAGDPYAADLHRQAAALGLGEHFTFAGFTAEPERIMGETDILVHPADAESFGRTAVEAMAAALPVVGVAGGGIGEIVVDGETGFLAPPDDAEALAVAVERLVRDPDLRHRFGTAGRKRAEACYSVKAYVEAMVAVYQQASLLR
jgi:glycosyltransferase involved in cell wall biosynthesis